MSGEVFPPGPRSKLGLGLLRQINRDPIPFLTGLARQHGDIAHFRIMGVNFYLINHPDYVKDVLVTSSSKYAKARSTYWLKPMLGEGLLTSESDFHLRQRRLVQPAFHRQRIAAYGQVMADYAGQAQAGWQDGATLDIFEEMMRLTLRVVAKCLFNTEVEGHYKAIGHALEVGMEFWHNYTRPFGELLNRLPLPSVRRFYRARAELDAIVYSIINRRRAGGEDKGDLLSMLLMAQDQESAGRERMTDRQVRDEAMTLLLAGHETTANALTWTWYLLSQHPEIEARLHAELDEALEGRSPGVEDLPRLRYAEMVLSEAMRLYPPAWATSRRTLQDVELAGYRVARGSVVILSQHLIHHDPRFYAEPEKFDPDRWLPEVRAARPKFSYFPFGAGPRICIGEPFAWMEGVLVLAVLAQKWRLRLAPGQRVAGEPLVTLRPRYGMRMRLERRPAPDELNRPDVQVPGATKK